MVCSADFSLCGVVAALGYAPRDKITMCGSQLSDEVDRRVPCVPCTYSLTFTTVRPTVRCNSLHFVALSFVCVMVDCSTVPTLWLVAS